MTPRDPRRDGRAAHFGTMSAATVPRMWSGFNCASGFYHLASPTVTSDLRLFEPVTATPGLTQVGTQGGVVSLDSLFFMRYEGF